jgi:hypothetical protein
LYEFRNTYGSFLPEDEFVAHNHLRIRTRARGVVKLLIQHTGRSSSSRTRRRTGRVHPPIRVDVMGTPTVVWGHAGGVRFPWKISDRFVWSRFSTTLSVPANVGTLLDC